MFGTVAHAHVKPGHEQAVMSLMEEWNRERKPKVKGALASYLFRSEKDPNEMIMVAVFQDRDSYYANAADPAQDRWYRRLREHLAEDPVWEDGEIIAQA